MEPNHKITSKQNNIQTRGWMCGWKQSHKKLLQEYYVDQLESLECVSWYGHTVCMTPLLHFMFTADMLERGYLKDVHNCVYFALKVLENQFEWVITLVHALYLYYKIRHYL